MCLTLEIWCSKDTNYNEMKCLLIAERVHSMSPLSQEFQTLLGPVSCVSGGDAESPSR